jgi:hypothetical protein
MTKELAALDSGSSTDDQGITVGRWLDQWLDEFGYRDRSPKALTLYQGHVVSFWRPRLGQLRLRDLRRGTSRQPYERSGNGRPAGAPQATRATMPSSVLPRPSTATDEPSGPRCRRPGDES